MRNAIEQCSPSGAKIEVIEPEIDLRVCTTNLLPNPCAFGGLTTGPPSSLYSRQTTFSTCFHEIRTRPPGFESAPYLTALVTSS